jgi:hypothetical protein
LKEISVTQRGWTLDVLNAIRRLGKMDLSHLGFELLGKWQKGFANGKGREAD